MSIQSEFNYETVNDHMITSLWSIRMRASKLPAKSRGQRAKRFIPIPCPPTPDIHVSGAETICLRREIPQIIQEYVDRAITHPRGKPDTIVITIEELKRPLKSISALPVTTARCRSCNSAEDVIAKLLRASGISEKAIRSALSILKNRETMRGAGLLLASSGRRVEPDMQRGVRASRFGIAGPAEEELSAELTAQRINTQTVREALVLASKVASCRYIMAELCISDDPDYTTGYVASKSLGYIRIPHCKKRRDRRGGRIFFLREDADIRRVTSYLEKRPVIITAIKPCSGEKTIDEILDHSH